MNAANAYGLKLPVVEIGYAPLPAVRRSLAWPDASVMTCIRSVVVGITLAPPAFGALLVALLLMLGD
jgi:hypothetical protein